MSTFSPLLSLLLTSSMVRANIDLRASVFHSELLNISQIRVTGDHFIHVGMILTNVLGKTKHFQNNLTVEFQMFDKKSKMLTQFERMLQSLFLYSRGTPLHFIFITDEESLPTIENTIKQEIGRYLSESVINKTPVKNQKTIFKFPKLRVEFVDIHSITSGRDIRLLPASASHSNWSFKIDLIFNFSPSRRYRETEGILRPSRSSWHSLPTQGKGRTSNGSNLQVHPRPLLHPSILSYRFPSTT